MAKTSGIDRRGFVAGTVALGTAGAAADMPAPAGAASAAQNSVQEKTMTTATIDGLEVNYVTHGLPQPEFWPVMPPDQTPDRILEFGRAHR